MGLPDLPLTATTVRVPVVGHSESVYAEFATEVSVEEARQLLGAAPGVVVRRPEALYPLAVRAAGGDPCFVGGSARTSLQSNALNFWVVADNLRKGAALNAVQIADLGRRAGQGEEAFPDNPGPCRRRAPPWMPGASWAPGKSAGRR